MKLHLILGNKNYSSWSLRAWIMLARTHANFTEEVIALDTEQGAASLKELCPAGLVPVLMRDEKPVWESLAILETIAELFPEHGFLPQSIGERALVRSVSAEMHAGFTSLRRAMPMNCRASIKLTDIAADAQTDIDRVDQLWCSCLEQSDDSGPWLFGHYSIADAMFAPVVSRFHSYQIELSPAASRYVETVISDPFMQSWYEDAKAEEWAIEKFDAPFQQ